MKYILFFVSFIFSIALKGQVLQTKFLVDEETDEVIPYADLMILPENYRILSSTEGSFELHSTSKDLKITLKIDALGYEPLEIKETVYKIPKRIKLKRQVTSLNEVIVEESVSPLYVIKNVVKNLKKNFSRQAFNSKSYSVCKIAVEDSLYLDLEFVADIYHRGYHQGLRETKNIREVNWKKGEIKRKLELFAPFLIKSYQVNLKYKPFLEKRKIKNFQYTIKERKVYEGRAVYVIEFKTDKSNFDYTHGRFDNHYSGLIFVDQKDFAVLKIIEKNEYTQTDHFLETGKGFFWGDHFQARDLKSSINETDFQKNSDGFYYMSKAKHTTNGFVKTKKGEEKEFNENYTAVWYAVQTENINKISFRNEGSRLDKVKKNPSFWENFAISN